MKVRLFAFGAVLIVTSTGCVTSVVDPLTTHVYAPKADLRQIQVVSEPPQQPYEEIAQLTAYGDYLDKESVLDGELRRQAAKLGADAVIRNSKAERYVGAFTAGSRSRGLAIRYKTTGVGNH